MTPQQYQEFIQKAIHAQLHQQAAQQAAAAQISWWLKEQQDGIYRPVKELDKN